jgi:pilus assembly protein CpaE
MTILWDYDPNASETYRFALGGDAIQMNSSARVSRALEDDPTQALVIIGPDIDLESACELSDRERVDRPELGVILLRHRLDVTALAQALRSGVREVVQVDDQTALAEAVRRSLSLTQQLAGHTAHSMGRDGKVITVFSAKGGVGKTTLSTNLATYLASTGARTLLVDLDLMFGDVAISLQLQPHGSVRDIAAMSGHLDEQGVQQVVTTHQDSGLDVIAAPADPADADRVPSHVVVELLRIARLQYDYILVDTPPSFTEHVLAAFDVSDLTVLIATLDIPAVKNLRIAINTLDTLGATRDARTIVLNRSDAKVGLKADDVEAALKTPISANVPNSLTVPASINRGVALVLDEPRNPVSVAIRDLADNEIRHRFGEDLQNGAKRGFGLFGSKK